MILKSDNRSVKCTRNADYLIYNQKETYNERAGVKIQEKTSSESQIADYLYFFYNYLLLINQKNEK